MSFGKGLYFPYIHFQNEDWLKYCLLYWDGIKRIVPPGYTPQDSPEVKTLVAEGIVENINPQDGETPYAKGAADEFLPTLEELLTHRSHLGRGAGYATAVAQNAPAALVHVQKMDQRVIEKLEQSNIARQHGGWLSMNSAMAGYYMLCLAAHIGEKQQAPLLSDSFEMETGGTYFQHSRIPASLQNARSNAVSFQLARMVLPIPRPKSLAGVSMKKILKFRQRRQAERMRFRQAIEKTSKDAAGLKDRTAIEDFLHQQQQLMKDALEDQRETMRDLKAGVAHSLFSISVPSAITAVVQNFNPIMMALGTTLGLAFSAVSWAIKARADQRKAIRQSDYHYLLQLKSELKPAETASQIEQSFKEFILD